MKPVLLLDVDGVLCPFPAEQPEGALRFDVPDWGGDLWVWILPEMKERLSQLKESFDLMWATAWEERANEVLLDHFGLDPLPVIGFGVNDLKEDLPDAWKPRFGHVINRTFFQEEFEAQCWKLPWIVSWALETDRPFAWVDDDIDKGTVAWAEHRSQDETPTLALSIDYNIGLTDEHVDVLEEWARSLTT